MSQTNKNKIERLLKTLTLDEVNDVIKLAQKEKKLIAKKIAKGEADNKRLREFLVENNIALNTVSGSKFIRPPKYSYADADGNVKTWAGVGRTPIHLQKLIDNGAKLEDFLIIKK